MADWHIRPAEPIGHEKIIAFDGFVGLREIDAPIYPDKTRREGKRLRTARVGLHIGLSEASRQFGVTPLVLSAVERGAMTGDVDAMIAALESGGSDE